MQNRVKKLLLKTMKDCPERKANLKTRTLCEVTGVSKSSELLQKAFEANKDYLMAETLAGGRAMIPLFVAEQVLPAAVFPARGLPAQVPEQPTAKRVLRLKPAMVFAGILRWRKRLRGCKGG